MTILACKHPPTSAFNHMYVCTYIPQSPMITNELVRGTKHALVTGHVPTDVSETAPVIMMRNSSIASETELLASISMYVCTSGMHLSDWVWAVWNGSKTEKQAKPNPEISVWSPKRSQIERNPYLGRNQTGPYPYSIPTSKIIQRCSKEPKCRALKRALALTEVFKIALSTVSQSGAF